MILRYLRPKEWGIIAVCVLLTIAQVWFDLEIPGRMSEITTIVLSGGSVDQILDEGLIMLGCAIAAVATAIAIGALAAYVGASFSKRLRELQFSKVESFSMNEINAFSTPSLITRSTNDVTQVQRIISIGLHALVKAPIMAIWALSKIWGKSWEWTSVTAFAVLVVVSVLMISMQYVVPRYRKVQWLTDNLNRVTGENISGIRVVRSHNAEDYQEGRFDEANDALTSNNLYAARIMSAVHPIMSTTMSMLTMAIYWIGAMLISSAGDPDMQLELFSDTVVFSSYAVQVVSSFIIMANVFVILPRAMVAARRVEEVIKTEPSINDGPVTESPIADGNISFENVGFRYPGAKEYVLKDISFNIQGGETVAFIGSTGSGKSTLISLVPRFYDVTEGSIRVDGVDVREYTQDALHGKIGYVPQSAVLFSGTVRDNVAYGKGANDSEQAVRKALDIAQGKSIIDSTDNGLDSRIAQRGSNLSGGQKQRISIARAVCRNPEIYILDDSFSALDYKTDHLLREALRKEAKGVTKIIVAQRVGTIMDADKIVVLDEGRLVGLGKHSDLLRTCPIYLEIARSQLSDEELGI